MSRGPLQPSRGKIQGDAARGCRWGGATIWRKISVLSATGGGRSSAERVAHLIKTRLSRPRIQLAESTSSPSPSPAMARIALSQVSSGCAARALLGDTHARDVRAERQVVDLIQEQQSSVGFLSMRSLIPDSGSNGRFISPPKCRGMAVRADRGPSSQSPINA